MLAMGPIEAVQATIVLEEQVFFDADERIDHDQLIDFTNESDSNLTNSELFWDTWKDGHNIQGVTASTILPPNLVADNRSYDGDWRHAGISTKFTHSQIMSGASKHWWRSPFSVDTTNNYELRMRVYRISSVTDIEMDPDGSDVIVEDRARTNKVFDSNPQEIEKDNRTVNYISESQTLPSHLDLPENVTEMTYHFDYIRGRFPVYPDQHYFTVWSYKGEETPDLLVSPNDVGNNDQLKTWDIVNGDKTIHDANFDVGVVFTDGQSGNVAGDDIFGDFDQKEGEMLPTWSWKREFWLGRMGADDYLTLNIPFLSSAKNDLYFNVYMEFYSDIGLEGQMVRSDVHADFFLSGVSVSQIEQSISVPIDEIIEVGIRIEFLGLIEKTMTQSYVGDVGGSVTRYDHEEEILNWNIDDNEVVSIDTDNPLEGEREIYVAGREFEDKDFNIGQWNEDGEEVWTRHAGDVHEQANITDMVIFRDDKDSVEEGFVVTFDDGELLYYPKDGENYLWGRNVIHEGITSEPIKHLAVSHRDGLLYGMTEGQNITSVRFGEIFQIDVGSGDVLSSETFYISPNLDENIVGMVHNNKPIYNSNIVAITDQGQLANINIDENTSYDFALNYTEYEDDLYENEINQTLRNAFEAEGYDVEEDATLVQGEGLFSHIWYVYENGELVFRMRIRESDDEIQVFQNVVKVDFDADIVNIPYEDGDPTSIVHDHSMEDQVDPNVNESLVHIGFDDGAIDGYNYVTDDFTPDILSSTGFDGVVDIDGVKMRNFYSAHGNVIRNWSYDFRNHEYIEHSNFEHSAEISSLSMEHIYIFDNDLFEENIRFWHFDYNANETVGYEYANMTAEYGGEVAEYGYQIWHSLQITKGKWVEREIGDYYEWREYKIVSDTSRSWGGTIRFAVRAGLAVATLGYSELFWHVAGERLVDLARRGITQIIDISIRTIERVGSALYSFGLWLYEMVERIVSAVSYYGSILVNLLVLGISISGYVIFTVVTYKTSLGIIILVTQGIGPMLEYYEHFMDQIIGLSQSTVGVIAGLKTGGLGFVGMMRPEPKPEEDLPVLKRAPDVEDELEEEGW